MPKHCLEINTIKDLPEEFLFGSHAPAWVQHFPVANWQRTDLPTSIPLGPLAGGTRILPCLSGQPELHYRITLTAKQQPDCHLATMKLPPAAAEPYKKAANNIDKTTPWAKSHLDWFEINTYVEAASLEISSNDDAALSKVLLHCSFRASPDTGVLNQSTNNACVYVKPLSVPAFSQMVLPDKIKSAACAPVCMAMVMAYHDVTLSQENFVALNRHVSSGLYGVWPLNVMALNSHGLSATVRYFHSLDELIGLLNLGLPVPVSIAFGKNQLPGAPLANTAGHVLVVTGIQNGRVYVNDPAADSPKEVPRTYELQAFCRAWLNHHGIGYIISPAVNAGR